MIDSRWAALGLIAASPVVSGGLGPWIQGGAAILAAVLTIGHGILLWQFRQIHNRIAVCEENDKKLLADGGIMATQVDLERLRAQVMQAELDAAKTRIEDQRRYVHRDDWVRFSSQIDAKLDALYRRMMERHND